MIRKYKDYRQTIALIYVSADDCMFLKDHKKNLFVYLNLNSISLLSLLLWIII